MRRFWFWLRWSGRELRRRWVQVTVIALIIALGTGVQAGLGSTSDWRQRSYDASYAMLRMHDLRVRLGEGSFVPSGALVDALEGMRHPAWVAVAEERLIVSTQVDASTSGQTVLVPGRIVGVDVADGGPVVDGIWLTGGRALTDADDGSPVAVLEGHFASHYDLASAGSVGLPGGLAVDYVGTGYAPEYYVVANDALGYSFMAEANFAVVFAPLETAGALSGHEGQVNDLVLRLAPGVDRNDARAEVEAALAAAIPDVGPTVSTRAEDLVHRLLYGDLDSDQGTFNLLAMLMLVAAVFAAFNLTSRIVEAQRREIGIGMALGARRRTIALRPLLIGAEIALLGVVFGVAIGWLVGAAMQVQLEQLQPLPVWQTPFQPGRFVAAAALGFLLPFLATAWPVWRAVRVEPVQAIRTGHLASRGGGLAPLLKRVRLPGGSFGQIPVRNVVRAPRRTILTAVGIGAAIMALVGLLGMLDSLATTIDRINRERQAVEEAIWGSAREICLQADMANTGAFILSSDEWHPGVIGIVASKIVEEFYRPTALISVKDGVGKGSARSIPGFDLYQGLSACSDLLLGFGGHKYAAGLTVAVDRIQPLRERLSAAVLEQFGPGGFVRSLSIDSPVTFEELTFDLLRDIERMAPFGNGNPEPRFGAKGLEVLSLRPVKDNKHLKLRLRQQDSLQFDAIAFNQGETLGSRLRTGMQVAAVFSPRVNTWNGMTTIELDIKDVKVEK